MNELEEQFEYAEEWCKNGPGFSVMIERWTDPLADDNRFSNCWAILAVILPEHPRFRGSPESFFSDGSTGTWPLIHSEAANVKWQSEGDVITSMTVTTDYNKEGDEAFMDQHILPEPRAKVFQDALELFNSLNDDYVKANP